MAQHVWIAQCLCGPHRHCIIANAGECADRRAAAKLVSGLQDAVAELIARGPPRFNPWCGICGAPREEWFFDLGRTQWRTIEEATPALLKNEAQQAVARLVLGDNGKQRTGRA